VLLTYESPTVAAHRSADEKYKTAIEAELERHFDIFAGSALPVDLALHLFLFPMLRKDQLQDRFDDRLKGIQGRTSGRSPSHFATRIGVGLTHSLFSERLQPF
jgi:hypothetical protein